MDPASVIGMIAAIGEISKTIYVYGSAVASAKTDVAALRSELLALQAALLHVAGDLQYNEQQTQVNAGTKENTESLNSIELLRRTSSMTLAEVDSSAKSLSGETLVDSPFGSPILATDEASQMLQDAKDVIEELLAKLKEGLTRRSKLVKKLVWPLKKEQADAVTKRLERLKSYFIMATTHDILQLTKGIADDVRNIKASMQTFQTSHVSQTQLELRRQAREWFSPTSPSVHHEKALASRLPGTGAWLLENDLVKWIKRTDSRDIWLQGSPGTGKTCMMAACVEKANELAKDAVVVCFYCSLNERATQEPVNIVGSLLTQICDQKEQFWPYLTDSYEANHQTKNSSAKEHFDKLIDLFIQIRKIMHSEIFVLIDAINECRDDATYVLDTLLKLCQDDPTMHLMISSTEVVATPNIKIERHDRDERTLKGNLNDDSKFRVVKMDLLEVNMDINAYVESRLEEDHILKRLQPAIKEKVKYELRLQARASFRWAQCTVDSLSLVAFTTPKKIDAALKKIPQTLEATYTSILASIPPELVELSVEALHCMVTSHMPLSLSELAEAAAFSFEDDFGPDDRLLDPMVLIRSLQSLVRFNPRTTRTELAHSSVLDYLTSEAAPAPFRIQMTAAAEKMVRRCVLYLTLPAHSKPVSALLRRKRWPFYYYASQAWSAHARLVSTYPGHDPSSTVPAIKRFLDTHAQPRGGNFSAWYHAVFPNGGQAVETTHPLYMCAREGLDDLIPVVLASSGPDALERGGGRRGSTPVHVACAFGQLGAVRVLLAAGADAREINECGERGVELATMYGYWDVVVEMLAAGADGGGLADMWCFGHQDFWGQPKDTGGRLRKCFERAEALKAERALKAESVQKAAPV